MLVMEKMECNLTEYLSTREKGSIPEDLMLNILLDVSKGLVYLHEEMKVAHRDLCSNNILLSADMSAKIADLGSARVLDRPGGWASHVQLTIQPGNRDFMPPEALENSSLNTQFLLMYFHLVASLSTCVHRNGLNLFMYVKENFVLKLCVDRNTLIEMAGSSLLPMVLRCLSESSTDRPASAHVMSSLQAMVEESKLII